ncbi:MAG: efflux transporter outer membrane subunit [Steroidobacter sp.]
MRLMFVAMISTALAGCMVGPDFKRPDVPTTARYTDSALTNTSILKQESVATSSTNNQTMANTEWWKAFHSNALNDMVQRALQNNHSLEAANWSLAEAQELANARAGTRLPQVALTGGTGRDKYGAEFLGSIPPPPTFTYYAAGAAVSYTLDYTGGIARSIEQQRALVEYQQQQLNAAHIMVAGDVVLQVLHIASLNSQIATLNTLLDRDRDNLHLVQVAFDNGSVSKLDVISAESQLASDMTLMPSLQQELSTARHALAVIMGSAPADAQINEVDLDQLTLPQNIPVIVPSELARQRPDILAAEAQLHAATAAVGVATANLYPHLDLSGSISQQALTVDGLFDRSSNAWSAISSITAPLFNGGTLRAEKRAAVNAMKASAENYQQTVLVAFQQVADALDALDHVTVELQARAQAEKAARDTVDLTRKSYSEGNVGVIQVLDAERHYQQARLGDVRARAQQYIDVAQLLLALGGNTQGT